MKDTKLKLQISILWVGISEKPTKNDQISEPLSPLTTSGKIIHEVELLCPGITFSRTNLVKMAPLDNQSKLRYPTIQECNKHFPALLQEIDTLRPDIVFLLGKQVAAYVFNQVGIEHMSNLASFDYQYFEKEDVYFSAIHHPAYIAIYKRKQKKKYARAIKKVIERIAHKIPR